MTTIASRAAAAQTLPSRIPSRTGIRLPVWAAAVCSRLVVLVAGVAAALLTHRAGGWQHFDATRISSSLGSLGNVLAAPAVRWDAIHYLDIAQHGYASSANAVFLPFYPLLIHLVGWITRSDVIAGVLISLVAFTVGLVLLHRITREELGERAANATVLLLAFAPLSFFFTAIYTESLLFALSVGAFYLARREHFVWASIVAGAAALTEVPGVILVAPLAVMYWQSRGLPLTVRSVVGAAVSSKAAPLLAPFAALASLACVMHLMGYGWLAPLTNQSEHNRTMIGPLATLWRAVPDGIVGLLQTLHGVNPIEPTIANPFSLGFQNMIYLLVLAISLCALVRAWRTCPKAYGLYATLAMIVFTSDTVTSIPLLGLDRFVLPIFPLWMAAAGWLEERRLLPTALQISTLALIFYTVEFSRWVLV